MKILLPVDGSACAQRAVDALVALAGAMKEAPEVHLLHVHPPVPIGLVRAHVSQETLEAHYREESEAQMRPARERLEAAGISFRPHIHVGEVADIIAKLAKEFTCDLIVMGTHGRGAMGNLTMGSVAAKVVHLSHCPVQLVK